MILDVLKNISEWFFGKEMPPPNTKGFTCNGISESDINFEELLLSDNVDKLSRAIGWYKSYKQARIGSDPQDVLDGFDNIISKLELRKKELGGKY